MTPIRRRLSQIQDPLANIARVKLKLGQYFLVRCIPVFLLLPCGVVADAFYGWRAFLIREALVTLMTRALCDFGVIRPVWLRLPLPPDIPAWRHGGG